MRLVLVGLAAVALGAGLVVRAEAQGAAPIRIRGTIEQVDGATLALKSRSGQAMTVHMKGGSNVMAVVPAKLTDVHPGDYVGVAATPGADGGLKALEVHIFPEAMRGTGDGSRPFDLSPKSSMTNGAVTTKADAVDGSTLTVAYKGGEQKIVVDDKTPVVAFAKSEPGDMKSGAGVIVFNAVKAADGTYDASVFVVGRGVTPPM
jgi:hypothetical protein